MHTIIDGLPLKRKDFKQSRQLLKSISGFTAILICFMAWGNPKLLAQINLKAKPNTNANAYLAMADADVSNLRMQVPGLDALQGLGKVTSLDHQAAGNARRESSAISNIYTLEYQTNVDVAEKITALLATGQFEWVEENRLVSTHAYLPTQAPNDPHIVDQWYHAYIETFAAWDSTRGDATVVVGVVDTGIDYGHPEFEGQLAINPSEDRNGNGTFEPWPTTTFIGGQSGDFDGIDNEGNGYIDDVIGYDFTDQPRSPFGGDYLFEDPDPTDDNNHGTLVSGIIAARADNNYGGAGIAPNCRIKVLRAFSASGAGEDDDIARAIVYAVKNNIKILNFSFGDIYPSQMMHEAIKYAEANGVVMVASAGNGTGDNLHYPSNFDEVISVSASALGFGGNSEILWPLSSHGHAVSLCAPGSGIYAPMIRDTANAEDFDFFSGTSTSAPMVTAAVALIFSKNNECSPQDVRGILTGSADDIGEEGWDHFTGAGRLNIRRALQTIGASHVQINSPQNDEGSAANLVPIVVTVLNAQFQEYQLEYQAGTAGTSTWLPIGPVHTVQAMQDTVAWWDISALPERDYTMRIRVQKSDGTTAQDRIRFVVDRSAPTIDLRQVAHAWDNAQRKVFWLYRASDRSTMTLNFKSLAASAFQQLTNDRNTRHGSFLLGVDELSAGPLAYYLEAKNEAGLVTTSPLDTFDFQPAFISQSGFDTLAYSLPMGYYISNLTDFDGDGLKEVTMSAYNNNLAFGQLKYYEYNATQFSVADSVAFKPVLIPKDIADTDNDGLLEVLCSVNDSIYILEQSSPVSYPTVPSYAELGKDNFAARFANVDADPQLELLLKDFKDYKVYEGNGNGTFAAAQTLPDNSGGYIGSISPRVLVEDFDGDGQNEVVFGDFDGDILIYEFNGQGYARTFLDTTNLTKSGNELCAGDFDGDGQQEFFVAVHTSLNRNEEDFEYEPLYWWLRIFKATGNDQYSVVWEDFLFDIDTEEFNAATAGNLDTDPADELVFTTFPRTYFLDYEAGAYEMRWFHYGDIATHHLIGDFNGNGVNEVAIGRGDKAIFWEQDFNYQGPSPVSYLQGKVLGFNADSLWWNPEPNATAYRIWRGEITGNGNVLINLIDSTSATTYLDTTPSGNVPYLYVLESKNSSLSPQYSPFSNAIVLRPHINTALTGLAAQSQFQVLATFDGPIGNDPNFAQYFVVNDSNPCEVYLAQGERGFQALLTFKEPFLIGTNQLRIHADFLDADRGPILPISRTGQFPYQEDQTQHVFFTDWSVVDAQTARIDLNLPMTNSATMVSSWEMYPQGMVTEVSFVDINQDAVFVKIEGAALGALGYPISLKLRNGIAQNGARIDDKSGNLATFSAYQDDNTQAFVYPNPYRKHSEFDGIRFANLSKSATVHIYTASGGKVITLQENNGDGGLEWNLIDLWGKRVRPGVYLFRVEAEGMEDFLGKFDLLE